MPKTQYPYVTGDPVLRSCRHCRSQVAQPAMCTKHPRTCMTCCNDLKRNCGLELRSRDSGEVPVNVLTAEEREAERIACAKICLELGFRAPTENELAEDIRWRTR